MKNYFIEMVYETLRGQLVDDARIPGVENIFADGSLCDRLYSEVYDANQRLCSRLGVAEDDDVEIIINALIEIEQQISYQMYLCGARFGLQANQTESGVGL